jgi:hypothetical protein
MNSTQINIRCNQETADSLKKLAESERMTLGALLEKLLACYQPAIVDSSPVADDWKVGMEARLETLERQIKALSADSQPIAAPKIKAANSAVAEPIAGRFKEAVIECYQAGIGNYQAIANQIAAQGIRNAKGNKYGRREVQRVIARLTG